MKTKLLVLLVGEVLKRLSPAMLKRVADKILDAIEDAVEASPNTVDDALVLPVIERMRTAFDIPDDDASGEPAIAEPGPSVNL